MRHVVILGATSAIAQQTARGFAHDHDRLVLVGRDLSKLQVVAEDLRARGASSVETRVADLADIDDHGRLLEEIDRRLPELDTVLLAYGTLADQRACEQNPELTVRELTTNFVSAASLLTRLAQRLEARRRGCLAVITSVAGDRGRQSNYVYGAAKGGLSVFLQGLRNRLARAGVAVVTIKPGLVDTPMTAGLKKGPLFASPKAVGRGVYRAIVRRREVIYLPWFWRPVMLIIRLIPERLFKRLSL